MPPIVKDFWAGLDSTQRTMVIAAGILLALLFAGALLTNASGWADVAKELLTR